MAQVTIRINGYAYTLGCEDGQETHLEAMAGEVDQRIDNIKAAIGQSGEARLLVLAALMMADELHDLKAEFAAMRKTLARAQDAPAAASDPKLGRRLSRLAKRAEEIAGEMDPS
jgi:cell division protein ZapA